MISNNWGQDKEGRHNIMALMLRLPMRDIPDLLKMIPEQYRAEWYDDMMSLGVGKLMGRRPKGSQ